MVGSGQELLAFFNAFHLASAALRAMVGSGKSFWRFSTVFIWHRRVSRHLFQGARCEGSDGWVRARALGVFQRF